MEEQASDLGVEIYILTREECTAGVWGERENDSLARKMWKLKSLGSKWKGQVRWKLTLQRKCK